MGADRLAQFGAVLANSGREYECISAIELCKVSANPVARLVNENIDCQLCLCVAFQSFRLNIADVIRHPRETFEPRLFAKVTLGFIERETKSPHHKRSRKTVQVPDAIILRQPGLRAHPKAVSDRNAIQNRRDAGTPAQMARDDPQVRLSHRRSAAIDVELTRAFGDICPPENFGGSFSNEFMTRAMKTPTAHAGLIPDLGHCVTRRSLGRPLIEGSFKQPDERCFRHAPRKEPDAGDIGRVMRRGDSVKCFHRLHGLFVQPYAASNAFREHGLETDCRHVGLARDMSRILELSETIFNGLGIVSHAVEATSVHEALLTARKVE